MATPTRRRNNLMRSYKNINKISPSCGSIKVEDIYGAISAAIFLLVGTEIDFVFKN